MIKIEIPKLTQEFEIGGEVFVMDLSLEATKIRNAKWAEVLKIFADEKETMTTERELELYKKGLNYTFGEGSFDKIYEMCGENLNIFNAVINRITDEMSKLLVMQSARDAVAKARNSHV